MQYNQRQVEDIVEIARTYDELSLSRELFFKGIEKRKNAERCLIAISNYRTTIPQEVQDGFGLNQDYLDKLTKECEETIVIDKVLHPSR